LFTFVWFKKHGYVNISDRKNPISRDFIFGNDQHLTITNTRNNSN